MWVGVNWHPRLVLIPRRFRAWAISASLVSPVFSITSATILRSPALRSAAIFWRASTAFGNGGFVLGVPQFDPTALGGFQGGLGAAGNHIPLVFGHGDQNMNQERGGVRIVSRDEIHLGILKGCNEVKIAGEAVKFGHQKGESVGLTFTEASAKTGRSAFLPDSTSTNSLTISACPLSDPTKLTTAALWASKPRPDSNCVWRLTLRYETILFIFMDNPVTRAAAPWRRVFYKIITVVSSCKSCEKCCFWPEVGSRGPPDRRPAAPFGQPPTRQFLSLWETAPEDRPACAKGSGAVVLTAGGSIHRRKTERPDANWRI